MNRFFAVELTAYRPGAGGGSTTYAWATSPWATPPQQNIQSEATTVIRASDSGYRTPDGTAYPAVLQAAVDLDRRLSLPPGAVASSVSWGAIRLINDGGRWDDVSMSFSSDGRPVKILHGTRAYEAGRGLYVDPPSSGLVTLFSGLAQGWRLAETTLEVPIRDASSWLEQPYQRATYGGTGGLDGDASLKGQTLPRARGGTSANPIKHVSPVLVDAAKRIYQCNDGPGSVTAVFENGAPFSFSGETTDLYTGTTAPATFRVDNSRGLFQLGSEAVGTVTAHVLGYFPVAGARSSARDLARYILTEDMALPAGLVDTAAFDALPANVPSGWYWPSGDTSSGAQAVSVFLAGLGAKLLPARSGALRPIRLRALPANAAPSMDLGTGQIIDLRPNVLPAPLDPPAYRWRIGYGRNNTVQGSGVSQTLTDDQRRALRQEWLYALWAGTDVLAAYTAPSDPAPVETALLVEADAAALASDMGALWSLRRRLYDLTLPLEVGMMLDIGSVVRVTYPFGDLRQGKLGQIVGDSLRGNDGTITVQVLV